VRKLIKKKYVTYFFIMLLTIIGAGCVFNQAEVDNDAHERELANGTPIAKIETKVQPPSTSTSTTQSGQNTFNEEKPLNNAEDKVEKYLSRKDTIKSSDEDKKIIVNGLDILVLVNKDRSLLSDYVPPDLTEPDIPFSFTGNLPKKLMRKEAAKALEELFEQATQDGIELLGQSAYRSYEVQESIFAYNADQCGEEEANRFSAYPGESEHQTGLAIDLTSHSVGFALVQRFGETPEGIWLKENAPGFGFIIRYPRGKEKITGYGYEPWHIRYVGRDAAKEMAAKEFTLEEYINNRNIVDR
jgi:D-alanyl-D-alanine carboxypeptidase